MVILTISFLSAQIVPFDMSVLNKQYSVNNDEFLVFDYTHFNSPIEVNLNPFFNYYPDNINMIIEIPVSLDINYTLDFIIRYSYLPIGSKIFLFDLEDKEIIGPFNPDINQSEFLLGPINASNFVIQCIIPIEFYNLDYKIDLISLIDKKSYKIDNNLGYHTRLNRENPLIVVTGFWPPTNEMIRHFSQSVDLNPQGWEGEDWQELGYDIVSFFPEFETPNCSDCGQGYGNFEVDYQDTSHDFWTLIDELNPISIITFSRGHIDYSWELEYNFYNRTNWYADYTTPFLPTPNPPDSDESTMFLRNSNLPMQSIVDTVNASGLGLNSYIDANGDPGHYVSEFMGYHGVWYRDLNQFSDNTCYLAGHVHVGGLIDWETSKEATELTILKVINALEEYLYILGDVNDDQDINVLDIVLTVSHILGNEILEGGAYYAADMNSDGIINIQDIILIINLIM